MTRSFSQTNSTPSAHPIRSRITQFGGLIATVLLLVSAVPGAAFSAQSTGAKSCPADYQAALELLSLDQIPVLRTALDVIITPRPGITPRWYFWSKKTRRSKRRRGADGRVRPRLWRGRVCTKETYTRRGRFRCRKWEPATPARIAQLSKWVPRRDPAPSRKLRPDLRLLDDTVVNQGALSAFKTDGRFYWLVRRVVSDLESYIRQPKSPNICSGVPTLLSFYEEQLEPLDERMDSIRAARRKAERALEKSYKRLVALRKKQERERNKAIADVGEAFADVSQISSSATAVATTADLSTEEGAVSAFMVGLSPLVDLDAGDIAFEPVSFAEARAALDAERLRAPSRKEHDLIVTGLRSAEIQKVSTQTLRIYREFKATIIGTMARIGDAHSKACTCDQR